MKRCPSCGQETKDDSQEFCTRCGAYFVAHPQSVLAARDLQLPDDPLARGMSLMDIGSFGEAVRTWDEAVRAGMTVDDSTYRRMLDSAAGCMLGTVMQPSMYQSAAVPQFASAMPDREFVSDLMSKLAGSLGVCSIQNGVLGLANPYMFLFLDCFAVYTDLRDLRQCCERACDDLGAMVTKASGLPDAIHARGPGPLEWLSSYRDFSALMRDTISDMLSGIPDAEADRLAEAWRSASSISYLGHVQSAFALSSQALAAGRIAGRMMRKTRDMQVEAFRKRYLSG